eukprot:8827119-Pyramimonas_sp.AAC.1
MSNAKTIHQHRLTIWASWASLQGLQDGPRGAQEGSRTLPQKERSWPLEKSRVEPPAARESAQERPRAPRALG